MCLGGGNNRPAPRPAPPPPAPYIPPPPAPVAPPAPPAPPPPRQISNISSSGEGGFKAGRKKKKDRSQVAKGTGQTRIPRVGVQLAQSGGNKSESGVGGLG